MNYMKEGPKLDLKLNLSPPRATSPHSPLRSMEMSPPSSCVSREESPAEDGGAGEATSMMMLVGCPRCLMYVMLAQVDPKCPKCKSSVLLDFFHEERANNSKKNWSRHDRTTFNSHQLPHFHYIFINCFLIWSSVVSPSDDLISYYYFVANKFTGFGVVLFFWYLIFFFGEYVMSS